MSYNNGQGNNIITFGFNNVNSERKLHFVEWAGTPVEIIREILHRAQVGSDDVVYDLGSGDGRILFAAVEEFGARQAVGYEIREDLCNIAAKQIREAHLEERIRIINGDLFDADLSDASVITLYLGNETNDILRPKLEQCTRADTRIVSYLFPMNGWQAEGELDTHSLSIQEGRLDDIIFVYRVPQAFSGC
ncbi:MAG: methyltransferase domain-containing protein [Dehalococcoidia bacterium]|nr:MAG: methyltransferase domain-containing protein [Dehalococcoidia bacterium]